MTHIVAINLTNYLGISMEEHESIQEDDSIKENN